MKNYLETIKDKVVVVKEDKAKTIAVTAAVCVGLALVATAVYKVCKTCGAKDICNDDDDLDFDDLEEDSEVCG